MAQYKKFQPNVEIELVDVPAGVSDEAWSRPLLVAKQAPDLFHVNNAAVVISELAFKQGTMPAVDMLKFAAEICGVTWMASRSSPPLILTQGAGSLRNDTRMRCWSMSPPARRASTNPTRRRDCHGMCRCCAARCPSTRGWLTTISSTIGSASP